MKNSRKSFFSKTSRKRYFIVLETLANETGKMVALFEKLGQFYNVCRGFKKKPVNFIPGKLSTNSFFLRRLLTWANKSTKKLYNILDFSLSAFKRTRWLSATEKRRTDWHHSLDIGIAESKWRSSLRFVCRRGSLWSRKVIRIPWSPYQVPK